MEIKRTVTGSKKGFTIVELLTVMSVIAILIALLVPALGMVRDFADEIQQKKQFSAIGAGLEMYRNSFNEYPPSIDNINDTTAVDATPYGGAQKLAEAMVGLDLIGFHPKSDFRSNGEYSQPDGTGSFLDVPVYDIVTGIAPNTDGDYGETGNENMMARKQFIETEHANAYQMIDVYDNPASNGHLETSFVLCDAYEKKRNLGKKTGMPILYFRARTIYSLQDSTDGAGMDDDVYDYRDNELMLDLQAAGMPAPTAFNAEEFDEMIVNQQVKQASGSLDVQRPYRAKSYIMMSAGKDGVYGTPDDLFNFEKKI